MARSDPAPAEPSLANSTQAPKQPFGILVFSGTGPHGYRHASIPAGVSALLALAASSAGSPSPFRAHATEDAIVFNPSTLAQYRVVVLLQSSGEFLDNDSQLSALRGFVRAGGGVVGIHGASAGLPSSKWYGQLVGAVFADHPEPQDGTVVIEDPDHPITASRGSDPGLQRATQFQWFDEWYNFEATPRREDGTHVLLSVRETSYTGGTSGESHPIAWCREFEGGRSFYTALGHFEEAFRDTWFLGLISNAILWAAKNTP